MNLSLRPATLEDAQRLLDWRNDIQTRLNSFNKEEVSWLDHVEWLKKSLQSSDRKIIIVEWGDLSVGTIRLDCTLIISSYHGPLLPNTEEKAMVRRCCRQPVNSLSLEKS